MRFVGIDSAYRHTGIVILSNAGALIERHHLRNTNPFDPQGFIFWQDQAKQILAENDVVAIEGLSYGSIGRSHVLAATYAVWLMEAQRVCNTMYIVPPIRVKKWAVDNVKAKKPELIAWAAKELQLGKKHDLSEHEADALALAQIARFGFLGGRGLPAHRQWLLSNIEGNGVTQTIGKSYFEGDWHGR